MFPKTGPATGLRVNEIKGDFENGKLKSNTPVPLDYAVLKVKTKDGALLDTKSFKQVYNEKSPSSYSALSKDPKSLDIFASLALGGELIVTEKDNGIDTTHKIAPVANIREYTQSQQNCLTEMNVR